VQDGIYKCELCGNVVSVLEGHDGDLVCCEEEMKLLEPKAPAEEGKEKHVPVIEQTDEGVVVKVGSVPHPMEDKHWISLIQLIDVDGKVVIGKRLKPGDVPEAKFCCLTKTDGLKARIFCNLHGIWMNA
jgi:superoxide reductase